MRALQVSAVWPAADVRISDIAGLGGGAGGQGGCTDYLSFSPASYDTHEWTAVWVCQRRTHMCGVSLWIPTTVTLDLARIDVTVAILLRWITEAIIRLTAAIWLSPMNAGRLISYSWWTPALIVVWPRGGRVLARCLTSAERSDASPALCRCQVRFTGVLRSQSIRIGDNRTDIL